MVGVVPQISKSAQLKLVFVYTRDTALHHCPARVTGKYCAGQ